MKTTRTEITNRARIAEGCGKEYTTLETELMEALSRFSIYDYITPVNLAEVEASFFEFGVEPVFEYKADTGEVKALEKWVRGLPLPRRDGCWRFLIQARNVFLLEARLARSVGSGDFEKYTALHTRPPSDREVTKATAVLATARPNKGISQNKNLDSREVARRLEDELVRLGMAGWRVLVGGGVARARVEASRRRLVIKGGEWFSEGEARRLLAHEVWGHALRAESGGRQPARILGTQYLGGSTVDEGIALHLEMAAGVWRGPLPAARHVVAVSAARKASFADIYKAIRSYTNTDREAFVQVARVKRGLRYTSKPGGWTKDVIYFRGLIEAQKYLSNASYFDVECLYVGKVPLSDCELIRQQLRSGMLHTPPLLPPPFSRENYKTSLSLMREAYAATAIGV